MPKPLSDQCKQLVSSPISYFEQERDNGTPLLSLNAVRVRVSATLNISIGTVSAISKKLKKNEMLKSSKKKRQHPKRVTNLDHLDVGSIRNQIYEMYEKKQTVNFESIHKKLKDMQLFDGCKTSLHTLLKELGFKWSKDNPRRGLMELPDITFKRFQFLKMYQNINDESLFDFVYLNETWIFQNATLSHSWQDDNKRSVKTTKVDGKRYIVLHAGNKNDFIPEAKLVFSSKTKGDQTDLDKQHQTYRRFSKIKIKNRERLFDRLEVNPLIIYLNSDSDAESCFSDTE